MTMRPSAALNITHRLAAAGLDSYATVEDFLRDRPQVLLSLRRQYASGDSPDPKELREAIQILAGVSDDRRKG